MKNIAAFFDIDGTVFRESLLVEHYKLLIKNKLIDESSFFGQLQKKYENWKQRNGDYEEYLLEIVDIYLDALKKVKKDDVDFIAKRVIEIKSNEVYTYTRDAIKSHLEKGHLVFIISGSPSFLVDKMAKKLNATDSIGTIYITDENENFIGKTIPMWDSESKIKAIKTFTEKYNIDLERSYSYGDTNGDFGMFKLVGNPVAINPNKNLFKKIINDEEIKNKIKIVIERKDMVYLLSPNVNYLKEGDEIL